MASLAAARIDFILIDMTNGALGGVESGNDWTATYAGDIIVALHLNPGFSETASVYCS
jgi:hypothetical protein